LAVTDGRVLGRMGRAVDLVEGKCVDAD
jgi:hypothetical protein